MKQTELIQKGIISASTMQRLRENKPVSLYTLDRLSCYLDVSLFELISADLTESAAKRAAPKEKWDAKLGAGAGLAEIKRETRTNVRA